ncbi:MAG TPA: HAD-IC family P-type ATPase [Solirubrobacteraceae bacterium]|nr:HAD-IC family P-type ATPase [Solirubrobacteraceae bacterium]
MSSGPRAEPVAVEAPPAPGAGLGEQEAARRLAARGTVRAPRGSRSYASIVRANVLTVFNAILAAFGAVTLLFGDARDALFLGIIVANATIGITQESRAKRALDRLATLVAPRAIAVRDGVERELATAEVVPGDLLRARTGDQIVADGELVAARELRLDESVLTGESEPVRRVAGEDVRSGAFVVEGTCELLVGAVGADSFAERIAGQARSFRHPRSPLEQAVNRLLYSLVGLVVILGALLGYSLYHRHASLHEAVATSTAGVVSLIPEGLMVLVSLTYAVAAARMARRGVLAQQLNAIESLASVEVLCVDKTGTLTEAALRVTEVIPAGGESRESVGAVLARVAASASSRNATLQAIAEAEPAEPEQPLGEVPFSSRRAWSAVQLADVTYVLGSPERFSLGGLAPLATEHQRNGRRVLALARGSAPLGSGEDVADRTEPALDPGELDLLGIVVLAERLRPNVGETIAFLLEQGVEVKVLSGDAPETVASIARDVGIPVDGVGLGAEIPEDPGERAEWIARTSVVGRISPDGKRDVVRALADAGRYVAMIGDGVNDVPALKASRLAIAQGSGAQMSRSVADLVLVSGDFAVVPTLVAEGRRSLRNLQRVTKLYVTKSAFAAFLILTIGISATAYPLLPRHFSLAAAVTIGIPTFFLALAPSNGPWRPQGFVRRVGRWAVPAGTLAGVGVVSGYLFALHDLDFSVARARTIATIVLVAVGLYLVIALEASGSRRRSALVAGMCAALAGVFVAAFFVTPVRRFFLLSVPTLGMGATAAVASLLAIGALALAGFSAVASGEPLEPD